jgi:hypothetical protein
MFSIAVGWNGESPSTYQKRSSVVHGWLTKIRGTLLDNEDERQKGIREMKKAKLLQERARQPKRGTLFTLFRGSPPKERPGESRGSRDARKPVARRHTMPAQASARHASNKRSGGDAARPPARSTRQSSSSRLQQRPSGAVDRPHATQPLKRRATTGGSHAEVSHARRPTAPNAPARRPSQLAVVTRTPVRQQSQRQPPAVARHSSGRR